MDYTAFSARRIQDVIDLAATHGSAADDRKNPRIHVMPSTSSWVYCDLRSEAQRANTPLRGEDLGWKLHLSVEYADHQKAWDAIVPILGGKQAKLPLPKLQSRLEDPNNRQTGKMLVLYLGQTDPADASGFLTDLESRLRCAHIKPSFEIEGDTPIPGSTYLFLRSDLGPNNRYVANHGRANPFGHAGAWMEAHVDPTGLTPALERDASPTRHARLLRLATNTSWAHDGVAWRPAEDAPFLPPSLRAGGAIVGVDAKGTFATSAPNRWHDALAVGQAGEAGQVLRSALNSSCKVGVRLDGPHAQVTLRGLSTTDIQSLKRLERDPFLGFGGTHKIVALDHEPTVTFRYGGALHTQNCLDRRLLRDYMQPRSERSDEAR